MRADRVIWSDPDHRRVINRFCYDMVDWVLAGGRTMVHDGRLVEPRLKHAIA